MTPEWSYLQAGDMTWEVWIRINQLPNNTQPIMSSRGPTRDIMTHSTQHRRRFGGVYLQSTGHLELRADIGDTGEQTSTTTDPINISTWMRVTVAWSRSKSHSTVFINSTRVMPPMSLSFGAGYVMTDGELVLGGSEDAEAIDADMSGFALWDIELAIEYMPPDISSCRLPGGISATGLMGFFELSGTLSTSINEPPTPSFGELQAMQAAGPFPGSFTYDDGEKMPPPMCPTEVELSCIPPQIWCG